MALTLMEGNEAIAWGAVAAGCRFFAGYPITPATTIYNAMLRRLPPAGGICLQGEDEIASIGFCLGASMAGLKTMTATSGPGISLYSEQISILGGGCAAMHMNRQELQHIPNVARWLDASREVKGRVAKQVVEGTPEEQEWLTEQINILVQMRNLLTYPYIRERYDQGKIEIFGWYYIIETGEIFNFNDHTETFELITTPPG